MTLDTCLRAGDRGGGREPGGASAERRVRHNQRVIVGAAAALSADSQQHLGREELHHQLPAGDRDAHPLHRHLSLGQLRPGRVLDVISVGLSSFPRFNSGNEKQYKNEDTSIQNSK